jgi:hypothetical protein
MTYKKLMNKQGVKVDNYGNGVVFFEKRNIG